MLTINERLQGRGKVLLKTIHGSRLYKLDHEDSDEDWFYVTEKGKGKHYKAITEDGTEVDVAIFGIDAWMKNIEKGTPQAIEALFSPLAEVDFRYKPMFDGMKVYSHEVQKTYVRLVKKLSPEDTVKLRRHACRLAWNLHDMRMYGRFNPSLSDTQVKIITDLATDFQGKELLNVLRSLIDIPDYKEVDLNT